MTTVNQTHDGLRSGSIAWGDRPALLVVDASRGFTDPASPLGASYDPELAVIAELMHIADGAGWPVFLSSVVYRSDTEASVFRTKIPALNVLQPDSDWVKIDGRLPKTSSAALIEKTFASCFFGTDLNDQLTRQAIDTLLLCGFTTSGCVRATAVDALQHNYRTWLVEDGCGDRDGAAHRANLRDIGAKYGEVIQLGDLHEVAGLR